MKKNILLSFVMLFIATCLMSQQAFAIGDYLRQGEYIRDSWIFNQGETETNAGVAVDSQGNIYMASTMTQLPEEWTPVVSENYVVKYDQNGTIKWVRTYPFEGGVSAKITAIAVDGSDNLIATGMVEGVFRNPCLTVKYSAAGEQVWARYYSNNSYEGDDKALDVAVDSAGNVYVAGKSYREDNYWNYTGFIIKWSEDGVLDGSVVNPKIYSDPGNENRDVAVDGNGNVYVLNYTQIPNQDYQLSKYDSDLVNLDYSNDDFDYFGVKPVDITTDSAGNLIVAGWKRRMDIMDDVEKNYHDFIKLNASGDFQCGREDLFTNPSGLHDDYDSYNAVTTDAVDNIYLAGTDQTTFLTIKFNSNCVAQWGDYALGTPDYLLWRDENRGLGALAKAIAVDADENIYVAGDSYTNHWFDDVYTNTWWPAWDVATVQYFKTDKPFHVDVFAQCVEHIDGKIAVDITGGPFGFFGTVTTITSYVDDVPVLGATCSTSNWDPPGVTNVYWEDTQIKAFCDICPAGVVVETNRGGRGESEVVPLP